MDTLRCDQCGAENAPANKFCGGCGLRFVARPAPVAVPGEEGVYFCSRHKKEATRVTCGRCEKPICPKCLVVGPAGVRCRECAKRKVPKSMRGMLHDASRGISGAVPGRVWYLAIWFALMAFIRNLFGGGRF